MTHNLELKKDTIEENLTSYNSSKASDYLTLAAYNKHCDKRIEKLLTDYKNISDDEVKDVKSAISKTLDLPKDTTIFINYSENSPSAINKDGIIKGNIIINASLDKNKIRQDTIPFSLNTKTGEVLLDDKNVPFGKMKPSITNLSKAFEDFQSLDELKKIGIRRGGEQALYQGKIEQNNLTDKNNNKIFIYFKTLAPNEVGTKDEEKITTQVYLAGSRDSFFLPLRIDSASSLRCSGGNNLVLEGSLSDGRYVTITGDAVLIYAERPVSEDKPPKLLQSFRLAHDNIIEEETK